MLFPSKSNPLRGTLQRLQRPTGELPPALQHQGPLYPAQGRRVSLRNFAPPKLNNTRGTIRGTCLYNILQTNAKGEGSQGEATDLVPGKIHCRSHQTLLLKSLQYLKIFRSPICTPPNLPKGIPQDSVELWRFFGGSGRPAIVWNTPRWPRKRRITSSAGSRR